MIPQREEDYRTLWEIELITDPFLVSSDTRNLLRTEETSSYQQEIKSRIVKISCPVHKIIPSSDNFYGFEDVEANSQSLDEKKTDLNQNNIDESQQNDDGKSMAYKAFEEGGRLSMVALSDLSARVCSSTFHSLVFSQDNRMNSDDTPEVPLISLEMLDQKGSTMDFIIKQYTSKQKGKNNQQNEKSRKKKLQYVSNIGSKTNKIPFVFERTDSWCDRDSLYLQFRVLWVQKVENDDSQRHDDIVKKYISTIFDGKITPILQKKMMSHITCVILQDRLRKALISTENNAVAFICNNSILPRKSGSSCQPMSSPPAIKFASPQYQKPIYDHDEHITSEMHGTLSVNMMSFSPFLSELDFLKDNISNHNIIMKENATITLTGMFVKKGVTVIVGGGYHGKSTLLQTIACGVYNKIPGDGREYCVTNESAITIRAEDGRYVNNCNISAFISNLPNTTADTADTTDTLSSTSEDKPKNNNKSSTTTSLFSTYDASGSTSQASNVSEAIEMGAQALLVDEDISAANFMARDGRMRALVSDESITPLLYRVNGLFESKGISSVVVVGGVGDWLDVPHNVILMDKYVCYDSTKKASAISQTFSHAHVQYGGRGVVHRLQWDEYGTPVPRRPKLTVQPGTSPEDLLDYNGDVSLSVSNGSLLHLNIPDEVLSRNQDGEKEGNETDSDSHNFSIIESDDETGLVDLGRCEQLLGSENQVFGIGLCLLWLIHSTAICNKYENQGINDLLNEMDKIIDSIEDDNNTNFFTSITKNSYQQNQCIHSLHTQLVKNVGFAYRPRKYEVAMAMNRLRGLRLEEVNNEQGNEAIKKLEEKEEEEVRKKQEMLNLWNNRRKKRNFNEQFKK